MRAQSQPARTTGPDKPAHDRPHIRPPRRVNFLSEATDSKAAPSSSDSVDGQPRESWLVKRGILLPPGPARHIATSSAVNMLGNGMMSVSAVLFYTEVVGLSIAEVSFAIGLSTLVGMLGGAPVGRLADRRAPREIYMATLVVQTFATAALVLVQNFWMLVLMLTIGNLAQAGSSAARGPILLWIGGARQVRLRAYLRAAVNLTFSGGLLVSALAIQFNTRTAYTALILANAVTFLVAALALGRLPHIEPSEGSKAAGGPGNSKRTAFRDRPYLAFSALNAITSLQAKACSFALPLWIVLHTHAPRWLIATSLVIGTVMVAGLQVRMTHGVVGNQSAARLWRRSGWALFLGMGLIGSSGSLSTWLAAALIVGGIAVMTIGEIQQSAGCFELCVSLAPADAQGEYSGVFNMGISIANVVAPPVLGFFCVNDGPTGWWLMGGVFAACSLAVPAVVRWSERAHRADIEVADPLTA